MSEQFFPWRYNAEGGFIEDRRGVIVLYIVSGIGKRSTLQDIEQRQLRVAEVGCLAAAAGDMQAAGRELLAVIEEIFEKHSEPIVTTAERFEPELTGLRTALDKAEGK
jgi:hypothetical protein